MSLFLFACVWLAMNDISYAFLPCRLGSRVVFLPFPHSLVLLPVPASSKERRHAIFLSVLTSVSYASFSTSYPQASCFFGPGVSVSWSSASRQPDAHTTHATHSPSPYSLHFVSCIHNNHFFCSLPYQHVRTKHPAFLPSLSSHVRNINLVVPNLQVNTKSTAVPAPAAVKGRMHRHRSKTHPPVPCTSLVHRSPSPLSLSVSLACLFTARASRPHRQRPPPR
jgi:hypothetical protein